MLAIKWENNEECAGNTDVFNLKYLIKSGYYENIMHLVIGPRGGVYKAKCNIKTDEIMSEIDYISHASFNKKNNMLIGVMRIFIKKNNITKTGVERK